MPYGQSKIDGKEDWLQEFRITCDLMDEVNSNTDVRAFCVVGPYPVQFLEFSHEKGVERAFDLMREGIAAASELVEEGRAIGIGEVGRPHFPTDEEIMSRSNELLEICMETARDLDCPVVLHTENANERNLEEFSQMARRIGLKPHRVIKHYCGLMEPNWPVGEISLSILSTKENISSAIRNDLDFMMESDYLDDPERPGAVLSLQTVPRRTMKFFEVGLIDEKRWERTHIKLPEKAYGIEIE